MEAIAIAGWAGSTALAITVAVLAMRMAGLRTSVAKARADRDKVNADLTATAAEFGEYRTRARRQLQDLRDDIEELDNDLANCATPGATRSRLERLLQKTEDRHSADSGASLPS